MAETVGVRELRQNLSKYLDRVKAGEALTVTEHGEPVADLLPRGVHPAYLELARKHGATIPKGDLAEAIRNLPPGKSHPAGTTDAWLAESRRDKFE